MMQIHLLFRRFEQHQEIVWSKEGGAVQDRTIYEDTIFASLLKEAGFIDQRDYQTYIGHFHLMKRYLVYDIFGPFNLLTGISRSFDSTNSGAGSAGSENGITLDYMEKLHSGYENFAEEMNRYTRGTNFTLEWNQYQDTDEVVQMIIRGKVL